MREFTFSGWELPILPGPELSPAKMGLELEFFGFDALSLAPLGSQESRLGPEELLERAHSIVGGELQIDSDSGVLIGLQWSGGNFSLEPGGQLEYASPPRQELAEVATDLKLGLQVLEEAGAGQVLFFDHGSSPVADLTLPLVIPKKRYEILDRYFASQPQGRGVHMMRFSATAQPNIDVAAGDDWVDAVKLVLALTPLVRILFANSRYFEGQLQPKGSERQRIWAATDPSRSGIPPLSGQTDQELLHSYVDWAQQANVFLVPELELEEQPRFAQLTFADWMEKGFAGRFPGLADWKTHLNTLFPDLRLRKFLEIRMVDAPAFEHALAPLAFWWWALAERPRLWQFLELHPHTDEATARALLSEVISITADDLARQVLTRYAQRPELDYPASGWDFLKAQGTLFPSRLL
jgi:glutamate--cysteine ligase